MFLAKYTFMGILKVHKSFIPSFRLLAPENTRYVANIMFRNIIMKKMRKPYRNHLVVMNLGMGLFLDSFFFLPRSSNSCPLPQYLLQYVFPPPNMEIKRGVMKQMTPSHANNM